MKSLILFVATLAFAGSTLADSHTETKCYSRSYTSSHMKAHKNQSLSKVKAKIFFDKDEAVDIWLKGTSKSGEADLNFFGMQSEGYELCAEFMTSGPQHQGCANLKFQKEKNENIVLVRPVRKSYQSEGNDMYSPGIKMQKCIGPMSDSDGCLGSESSITLSQDNPEDKVYKLYEISCLYF